MKKRSILFIFTLMLTVTTIIPLNVNAMEKSNYKILSKGNMITESDLQLSQIEKIEFYNYQNVLGNELKKELLKNNSIENIDKVIQHFNKNNTNIINKKILFINYGDNNKNLSTLPIKNIDNNLIEKFSKHFYVNEKFDIIITPIDIYIDEFDAKDISYAKFTSTWKVKEVATRRSLFTTAGKRAASVHANGKIKYNGKKATYHSDFNAYYKLYNTTYKKDDFYRNREASGNSYQFFAQGIFYKGIHNLGYTKRISCKVKVSPKGNVTKSYYPAL